jgi:hypothetical protein
MNAEDFLAGLSKVRKGGAPGEWVACCPAHNDKSPSLAVKQADDGRILIHCFAGCSVEEVVAARGVDIGDLFPERLIGERLTPIGFNPRTLLKAMAFNAQMVAIVAGDIVEGRAVSEKDMRAIVQIKKEFESVVDFASR